MTIMKSSAYILGLVVLAASSGCKDEMIGIGQLPNQEELASRNRFVIVSEDREKVVYGCVGEVEANVSTLMARETASTELDRTLDGVFANPHGSKDGTTIACEFNTQDARKVLVRSVAAGQTSTLQIGESGDRLTIIEVSPDGRFLLAALAKDGYLSSLAGAETAVAHL